MDMCASLKGKSAIVTGATQGIGKGIARALAQHGARVAVVGRDRVKAQKCAEEFRNQGYSAQAFTGDVTDRDSMEHLAHAVADAFGGIDILCANAGVFPNSPIEHMTGDAWDVVMNTNVKGNLFSLQACLPYLKKASHGRVILTSSITGPVTGYAGWAHYGASKAAQLGFMRSAALELAPFGITINAVLPGNILTEGLEALGAAYLDSMAAAIPVRRLGSVDDVAYAALFLASPAASFITGQTLIVDGGQTLPESLDAMG